MAVKINRGTVILNTASTPLASHMAIKAKNTIINALPQMVGIAKT
jgi:hypothetical protein